MNLKNMLRTVSYIKDINRPYFFKKSTQVFLILCIAVMISSTGYAQSSVTATPETSIKETEYIEKTDNPYALLESALSRHLKLRKPDITPDSIGTLLFTRWQHALLQEAKIGFLTRPPTQREITETPGEEETIPRGIREVSLSGIVYANSNDWVIWLNGQRVTPDAIPEQVIDLKVRKAHVDIKWFDAYSNLIYPIRLRPHQRFNLDSRIFLPGTS